MASEVCYTESSCFVSFGRLFIATDIAKCTILFRIYDEVACINYYKYNSQKKTDNGILTYKAKIDNSNDAYRL